MKKFWIVLRKELLDCFRDKRSIVMMLLPLLVFPLMLTFYNEQVKAADEKIMDKLVVATNSENDILELTDLLSANGTNVEISQSENITTDLKAGKIALIINRNENGYQLIYDQNSIKSTKALNVVISAIEMCKTAQIYTILNLYGEDPSILLDYHYDVEDVSASAENEISALFSVLGPMMIVIFISTGGTGIALDLFCGEKERGSLEGLLSTQINRAPLYLAKTVSVFVFVCFGALISVGGYLISFAFDDDMLTSFEKNGIGMSGTQILLFFIITITFALFTAAIISMLSLSAKTVKEGSLRISLFTLIPTVIGGISMYIETGNVPVVINYIPIVNTINALKSVFLDTVNMEHFFITVASTFVYGLIFLMIGYRLMNSEQVLSK